MYKLYRNNIALVQKKKNNIHIVQHEKMFKNAWNFKGQLFFLH